MILSFWIHLYPLNRQELNDIYQNMNTTSTALSYRDGWLNVKIKLFLYFYRVDLILNVFK